jgi:hypothetical protein
MMVNGWRSYYWDDLQKYKGLILPHKDDAGLTVKGKVKKLFSENPVGNGIVELGPFSSFFTILKDTTDKNGLYSFERLFLKDSALIMINAKDNKGSNRVELIDETSILFDSTISVKFINQTNQQITLPKNFYRNNFNRYMAKREYDLEHTGILLGEIDILSKIPQADFITTATYGFPSKTLMLTSDDWSYPNILDYLENKVAGLIINGDNISIRGAPGNPLFKVDGISQAWDEIKHFPMGDIARIDIYKNASTLAIFGTTGANGVISVVTKTGFGSFKNEFVRIIQGRITPRVNGFRQPSEFYSPKYLLNELDSNEKIPDQRPTLYWNPNLEMEGRKSIVEFYTSDMPGRYRIIVEGISQKGTICFGTAQIEVVSVNSGN